MTRHARQLFGDAGERAAAAHLEANGYRILAKNHRCPRGEVDLVAGRDDLLVFVEVRTRATARFGAPFETVTPAKQRKVIAAARDFLAGHGGPRRQIRFDVISVVDDPAGAQVEHIPGAFDAS